MKSIARFCYQTLKRDQLSQLAPLLAQGYFLNHCDKESIVLSKKPILNQGFFVGAGAIIFNEKQQVLLVQEKNGLMAGLWSFPSGLVNKNESLIAGMEREVFEETGLAIKYRGIFYIRQVEFTKWELPDVYFAILADLQAKQTVKLCPKELLDFKWIPISSIEEFAKANKFTQATRFGIDKLIKEQFAPLSLRTKTLSPNKNIFYC